MTTGHLQDLADTGEPGARTEIEAWKQAFQRNLFSVLGRFPATATANDRYLALAYSVRERLLDRWVKASETYYRKQARTVCYLSAEFLLGPASGQHPLNLGAFDTARQAMEELGFDFEAAARPGGGARSRQRRARAARGLLPRLARDARDSVDRLRHPLRVRDLRPGRSATAGRWRAPTSGCASAIRGKFPRPEIAVRRRLRRPHGALHRRERPLSRPLDSRRASSKASRMIPPIPGYRVNTANLLRLWSAEAVNSFDFESFNIGDYYAAVEEKVASETISKVLYPNDAALDGQAASARAAVLLRLLRIAGHASDPPARRRRIPSRFHATYAVQLNDTHPALAVAELMRLLVDEHGMDWEDGVGDHAADDGLHQSHAAARGAGEMVLGLFGSVLPRHLEIVYEINDDSSMRSRLRHPGDRRARATAFAHRRVRRPLGPDGAPRLRRQPCDQRRRGAAQRAAQESVLRDFNALWPERFRNVTNGVTPRRFMMLTNPELAGLLTEAIGAGWTRDLEELRALEPMADDAAFREAWRRVKQPNQGSARRRDPRQDGRCDRPRQPVRRSGQALPRVQAAASQHAARHRALSSPEAASPATARRRARSCSRARPRPAT